MCIDAAPPVIVVLISDGHLLPLPQAQLVGASPFIGELAHEQPLRLRRRHADGIMSLLVVIYNILNVVVVIDVV